MVLVSALREAGVPCIIQQSGARRGYLEQTRLVLAGRSRTLRSAHLAGKAFDIDVAGIDRSDIPRAFWNVVGPWAERQLGLKWGGRWSDPWDPGHFELP